MCSSTRRLGSDGLRPSGSDLIVRLVAFGSSAPPQGLARASSLAPTPRLRLSGSLRDPTSRRLVVDARLSALARTVRASSDLTNRPSAGLHLSCASSIGRRPISSALLRRRPAEGRKFGEAKPAGAGKAEPSAQPSLRLEQGRGQEAKSPARPNFL